MLPSETMIWQPEFTDKTLSRKPGAVQLFDPSCHCGKANIHSFGGICHRVFLVNNQLSGFVFKLCAKISFFHWSTCVVLR
ncbi:hypothetical protein ACN72_06110 [Escherichia coli]|nr:hypothetical protein ACN54_22110 [Escherichia coli]OKU00526.1 hypothetical protein ACN72_06110 [Escherichia coli]